ncbi:ethylbenzene dehydrogenase-related protein [Sinobacterium caligoides]|nr:ethylbenzene dehydrogenase-related protein [Sinobacterium caligoides]
MKKIKGNNVILGRQWLRGVVFITGLNCAFSVANAASGMAVESVLTPAPVVVDGVEDKQWALATPLKVVLNELPYEPNNGYKGLMETELEVRSLYDEEYIYFLYRWYDPTESLARFPWEKAADGSWKHLENKDSTLHENTYYEDKLSVYWDINQRGFIKKGCDKSCHMVEDGLLEGVKDTSAGRHYTLKDTETLDEWQWKGIRTNPNYQMDDGFVDNEHETNGKWGRHPDDSAGGGYYNNTNDTEFPAWVNGETKEPAPYWVMEAAKQAFVDTFQPGDRIGGVVTAPHTASRADVNAKGVWKDDHWQLEVKRKRITNYKNSARQDIQFNDLAKPYYFGVTAFDNSQINHLYHKKSIKLTFKQGS